MQGIKRPTLVSLFTGAGGLDIGLEMAGFRTILANELEPHACETLRQNKLLGQMQKADFSPWFEAQMLQRCYRSSSEESKSNLENRLCEGIGKSAYLDEAQIVQKNIKDLSVDEILKLTQTKIGDIDLIAGGPPCQPFSRAGKRESVNTEDGRLFKEFVRIVEGLRPRWFLFENVKGLTLTKTPIAYAQCNDCRCNVQLSFNSWELISNNDAVTCLCPKCNTESPIVWNQKAGGSLDIIVHEFESIGYKCEYKILNAADFGAGQVRERLFIVGSRDGENFEWPEESRSKVSVQNTSPALFDLPTTKPWITIKDALWAEGHWKYGKLSPKAVLWVKNVVRPHDEPVTWALDRPSPTIGAHQGAKLCLAPHGVPEEQLARQQWHTKGRRQGDTDPVFVEHEYLTDIELLKLQTFPKYWYLFGTRMQRAFQVGNAVPPVLAKAVGDSIIRSIQLSRATA
jgi:DNA (cytosine-5)-methyltransferase 1